MNNQLNTLQLKVAIFISFIIAVLLFAGSFFYGKINFFLLLNTDLGKIGDVIFKYATYLGYGIIFLPVFILFIIYRKEFIPLLIAALVFSTLIVHLFKDLLISNQPRPTEVIKNLSLIHTVPGIELFKMGSFPSGHTTTAFTVFFIACLMINKKWILPAGLLYGLAVGYSRIYLAEHFPIDVAGGIITAIITIILSFGVQQWWMKRK